jgi:hypothetical protein
MLWCSHLLRVVEIPIWNLVPVNRLSIYMFAYLFSRVQQILLVVWNLKYTTIAPTRFSVDLSLSYYFSMPSDLQSSKPVS